MSGCRPRPKRLAICWTRAWPRPLFEVMPVSHPDPVMRRKAWDELSSQRIAYVAKQKTVADDPRPMEGYITRLRSSWHGMRRSIVVSPGVWTWAISKIESPDLSTVCNWYRTSVAGLIRAGIVARHRLSFTVGGWDACARLSAAMPLCTVVASWIRLGGIEQCLSVVSSAASRPIAINTVLTS